MNIPINVNTHFSLLRSTIKPNDLVQFCVERQIPAFGICDDNTLSGSVESYRLAKKAGLKCILGEKFSLDKRSIAVFAKNYNGWLKLITLNNFVNSQTGLSWDTFLDTICSDLICISEVDHSSLKDRCGDNNVINSTEENFPHICYLNKEDAADHRVLLSTKYRTKLSELEISKVLTEDVKFLQSNGYYYRGEHCKLDEYWLKEIEDFDILQKPGIPKFADGDAGELLTQACREGWKKKIGKSYDNKYVDRIKKELEVIKGTDILADYFLIVQDFVLWAKKQGWQIGKGRGSAGGCLVSYLLDITDIDPVKYGLYFERFYNAGRNTEGHTSLPDIDIDFPKAKREEVIQYLTNKYGIDRVSHIVTFGKLKGRSVVKDVLRAHDACSFIEMNQITSAIPNEAEISDELQEMKEEEGDSSVVKWALLNNKNDLKQWCYFDNDNNLQGPLSIYFQQAMRLEWLNRSKGLHASGIIISKDSLNRSVPMLYHEKEQICGLEMNELESVGKVKFDILGVALMDKLMGVKNLLAGRAIDG